VLFFGLLGLLMVEGFAPFARAKRSRQALGEKAPGFVASMHRDFESRGPGIGFGSCG
jgi:hypothetical protein